MILTISQNVSRMRLNSLQEGLQRYLVDLLALGKEYPEMARIKSYEVLEASGICYWDNGEFKIKQLTGEEEW